MAIIITCDKCGITAETSSRLKIIDSSGMPIGDYHKSWEIMIAGSGMYLHPENFSLDCYKEDLGAILCKTCSEEHKKYKWELEKEIRKKNDEFIKAHDSIDD
jgi:hypothetical protein